MNINKTDIYSILYVLFHNVCIELLGIFHTYSSLNKQNDAAVLKQLDYSATHLNN